MCDTEDCCAWDCSHTAADCNAGGTHKLKRALRIMSLLAYTICFAQDGKENPS